MDIKIVKVNYNNDEQAKYLVFFLNAYASEPMGGREPLKPNVVKI